MEQKSILKSLLYVALFVSLFFVIQFIFQFSAIGIYAYLKGIDFSEVAEGMQAGQYADVIVISYLLSSITIILLFIKKEWSPISRSYLRSKPWDVLFWTAMLALGLILPAQFIYEKVQITVSENMAQIFSGIMKQPLGYLVIGILAPIAEELIFRGAILRVLLDAFGRKGRWPAIALTALLFAVIHGNLAQGTHAFVIGMVLGWLYVRTRSVLPGIVLHWVNNSTAYIMFHLMPDMEDGKLIDFFHGNEKTMYLGLFFSFCIFVPAIFQLAARMKRANE
ncbi:MAG: lysostaphin resistance A-like protein [Prevotella intermedia]